MPSLTPDQIWQNVITHGRAIVRIIEAAQVLFLGSRRFERLLLRHVLWLYKMRLRELVVALPTDISAEILAISDNITGPVGDISQN